MQIGGDDYVIDGPASRGEAEFVVSCLCAAWSDLVVQEADSDAAVGAKDPSVAAMREFFVYRSRADFESWNRNGASDDNLRTMIHVILGEDSTTVVADPGDELGLRLAEDITKRRSRP